MGGPVRWLPGIVLLVVACGGSGTQPQEPGDDALAGRTYSLKVPAGYDATRALPLIVAIHAYGSAGSGLEPYFGLDTLADEQGFFVVYPDGTVDAAGHRFFSATDACCDFYGTGVDDVAFFSALIDQVEAGYRIDPDRVFAVGHSNGGFMSHRLACDLSPRIAAIVSLEGATWDDPTRCKPTDPVAILEVHGTDDTVIRPAGGDVVDGYPDRVYPPLAQTMSTWAKLEGCDDTPRQVPGPYAIDEETTLPTVASVWNGCAADVELWSIEGGTHGPALTPAWPAAVVRFLMAHPKGARPVDVTPTRR